MTTTLARPIVAAAALLALGGLRPVHAQIAEFLGPHEIETLAAEIPGTGRIGGIAVDRFGYIYVANQDEGMWKIHPSGEVEHFVRGLFGSGGILPLPSGDVLQTSFNGDYIVRVERDGTVHRFADEGLEGPVGMALGRDGEVFTVNAKSNFIARIDPDGQVAEFVRDDRLRIPNGITADPQGNLYVVSLGNSLVLKVTQDGTITEIATLPGSGNAHVVFVGGALYVTQIWNHVVLRVAMDGTYEVVAGDGTPGFRDGTSDESRITFPNGIFARGNRVYFNTLRGNMVAGDVGTILVQRLHLPAFGRKFLKAFQAGGMERLRATFDEALTLREASSMAMAARPLYRAGNTLIARGHVEAGVAMTEWVAERDPDRGRAHATLGNVYLLYGDKAAAITNLEAALELQPDDERVQRRLEAARRYRRD